MTWSRSAAASESARAVHLRSRAARWLAPVALLLATTPAMTQDAPPGAVACTGCHALFPAAPNQIQSLSADEIAGALAGFRDGSREGTLMPRIASGFSDQESLVIAEWFAAQEDAQ
jgi:sulfide dehydrogenase cytochrome subunit